LFFLPFTFCCCVFVHCVFLVYCRPLCLCSFSSLICIIKKHTPAYLKKKFISFIISRCYIPCLCLHFVTHHSAILLHPITFCDPFLLHCIAQSNCPLPSNTNIFIYLLSALKLSPTNSFQHNNTTFCLTALHTTYTLPSFHLCRKPLTYHTILLKPNFNPLYKPA